MALRTRVWSAGKLLLLGGALFGTYLLFAGASMRLALRSREVQIPDLTGRTANEATAAASDLGLAIRMDETRRPDPKVPAGRVIGQDPPAGTPSRQQRSLRVWLSAGPRALIVPALAGETERSAQLRLSQEGLQVSAISEIRSDTYASDVIVAQDPAPKTASERVSLLVNRSEQAANYVMPDLIGVDGDRAAEILRRSGFRVAVVGSTPYPGVPPGIVLRQSPQGGFQIAPGEPISIEVSR
jgi:eukaryotic-like serine/threonine-protein kinase